MGSRRHGSRQQSARQEAREWAHQDGPDCSIDPTWLTVLNGLAISVDLTPRST